MTDLPGVPPPPDDSPDDPGAVQRPSSVDNSFWAGVASPVIGLLAAALELFGVVGPAGSEAFLAQLRRQTATQGGPAFAPEQMEAVYRIGLVVGMVFLVVLAALWIMFLLFMRGGRNWARVVVTVVGAIWFVLTLPQVFGPVVVLDLLAVLQLVAIVATIALAYRPSSNHYFQAIAARRR